jgi:hypothetical protein
MMLSELAKFLIEAKRKGYAGSGNYSPNPDGSRSFKFSSGSRIYEDTYCELEPNGVVGFEKSTRYDLGEFAAVYSGFTVSDTPNALRVLKKALLAGLTPPQQLPEGFYEWFPLRGPQKFESDGLTYTSSTSVRVLNKVDSIYQVSERIIDINNRVLHELHYTAGRVKYPTA